MSALFHTGLLVFAVVLAYVWLQIPGLNQYSLQIFAACIALYLVMKRLKKAEFWHIAPTADSLELALLSFAFLLVIGATGATTSALYPLTYILLFFVIFSGRTMTAIVAVATMMLYYYALSPVITQHSLSLLATLPLLSTFFVFARAQYQQVNREHAQHSQDEALLSRYSNYHQQLTTFVTSFIQPKLDHIIQLLEYPSDNQKTLLSQVTLLQVEIEKMTNRLKPSNLLAQTQKETVENSNATTTDSDEEASETVTT